MQNEECLWLVHKMIGRVFYSRKVGCIVASLCLASENLALWDRTEECLQIVAAGGRTKCNPYHNSQGCLVNRVIALYRLAEYPLWAGSQPTVPSFSVEP